MHSRTRRVASVLIVISVGLQVLAITRLLCPPRSMGALSWLRVACTPRLWPFVDYPMFSDPHAPGDVLAWVDARSESVGGTLEVLGSHEVRRSSPAESWDAAYARQEERLRALLGPTLQGRAHSLRFERRHLVLSADGLVAPACDGCPDGKP